MSEWTVERTAEVLLEAGWIVLTSEMTDAMPLQRGSSVTVRLSDLGSVSVAGV